MRPNPRGLVAGPRFSGARDRRSASYGVPPARATVARLLDAGMTLGLQMPLRWVRMRPSPRGQMGGADRPGIMGGSFELPYNICLEPKDSADDFPTPPWAARALTEHVLRR